MSDQPKPSKILHRAARSILYALVLVAIASAANFLTTAPKAISLLFEPISLLLMPGLLFSLVAAGPHDYSLANVLLGSLAFYTAFFYLALLRRSRTNH